LFQQGFLGPIGYIGDRGQAGPPVSREKNEILLFDLSMTMNNAKLPILVKNIPQSSQIKELINILIFT
jgi:hypothetical protein